MIDRAVVDAYEFISRHYVPGDQVVLQAERYSDEDREHMAKGVETLARHLHDGTRPGDRSILKSRSEDSIPTRRIPIHCIAVMGSYGLNIEHISAWNDVLKTRFPPGIEHIICYTWGDGLGRACSTVCDTDGSIISRQILHCRGYTGDRVWIHCTKHVIYYNQDWIPKWEEGNPVWTRELSSLPSGTQGSIVPELIKPAGMYRHELRKYQKVPRYDGDKVSTLVWKSSRN